VSLRAAPRRRQAAILTPDDRTRRGDPPPRDPGRPSLAAGPSGGARRLGAAGVRTGHRPPGQLGGAPGGGPAVPRRQGAEAEAFYRQRGLTPTIKLTAAARPAGLDEFLAGRGYRSEAEVSIQTLALTVSGAGPRLPAAPSPAWLEANAAVPSHYGAAPDAFLALIGRIGAQTGFASVESGGQVAAIGMAVAEQGAVGIFEVGTRPECRRRGLAREVMRTLLAWGAARGASTAYLQVMLQNTAARAMYEALGFTEAYRYWYRVAP
jgi:ribosomal protein S18 acetylase RimI-like enzyme